MRPAELAAFTVHPGFEQIAVVDAEPETELHVVRDGQVLAAGTVDSQGSLVFRNLEPGSAYVASTDAASADVEITDPQMLPDLDVLADQPKLPAGGFGYITVRDGTTLSANVLLPGPADEGPYPTVVEYSGYSPSDPGAADFAALYTAQGFAYVGVNMRGTGCSGGSYRFFETVQSLDGYDVIEAVAAQPWVAGHQVGMVGISYPGISQLYVAATRPPSLAAITPLSVLDDAYRSTLYPGGILNTGFAVSWTEQRMQESRPYGQEWTRSRAVGGDLECEANQELRLQNPDLVQEIRDNPFYVKPLGDPLAPTMFVDRINVPVFLAGAWQDEQTGGRFPVMLDRFTASPHVYATMVNGLHTESLSPAIFQRYTQFLQLYVARRVPDVGGANAIAPLLAQQLYGVDAVPPLQDTFAGMTYEQALAAFESQAPVQVLFEQGGSPFTAPGTPIPNFTAGFAAWPVPNAVATEWFLQPGGKLQPSAAAPGPAVGATYSADPEATPATFYTGGSSGIWRSDVRYDWRPVPANNGVGYVTAAMERDTVIVGSGSADLWIATDAADTDLEVTVSEVRPDGAEIYVQSGWQRASHRALDQSASTPLRPVHTNAEADAAPLTAGEATLVRVELFPFAHVFRAGSSLRITVKAPGGNRGIWTFESLADGEAVTVLADAEHPSKVVLSSVGGVQVGPAPPACGALRGQPCRIYVPLANGG